MLNKGPVTKRRALSWEDRCLTYAEFTCIRNKIGEGMDRGNTATRYRRWRDLIIVDTLAGTGLRASELCALNVADVHVPEKRDAWLRVIGGKKRTQGQADRVPIPKHLAPPLRDWREMIAENFQYDSEHCPLFPASLFYPFGRLEYRQLWEIIKRVARRAGQRVSISPHSFRHYYITELARVPGIDALMLASAARLRDPKTALRYIHFARGELHAIADRVRIPGRKRC